MKMLVRYYNTIPNVFINDPYKGMETSRWGTADYHVICVPTQQTASGNLDLSAILQCMDLGQSQGFRGTTIIRSTINPQDYDEILLKQSSSIISWPEFLREAHWEEDAVNPRLIVMAGPGAREFADNFIGLNITLIEDPRAAWMMKIARNAYYALKVMVSNELTEACDKLDIDYQQVKQALLADPMIGPSHWDQPGYDGSMGYGGKCLPKDTASLEKLFNNLKMQDNFASWAQNKNKKLRPKIS